jgi:hypothetical protein
MLNKFINLILPVMLILIIISVIYYTSSLYILIPILLLLLLDQRIRFKNKYFEIEYLKLSLDSPFTKPKLPVIIDVPLLFIYYIIWHFVNKVRCVL